MVFVFVSFLFFFLFFFFSVSLHFFSLYQGVSIGRRGQDSTGQGQGRSRGKAGQGRTEAGRPGRRMVQDSMDRATQHKARHGRAGAGQVCVRASPFG